MKIGIDLSDLKNELKEIKKNNESKKNEIAEKIMLDINNYKYINFTNDPEIDDFLNDNSFKILNLAAGANILLGSVFIEVQDYLSNLENADATYIKWLESNGFNRMTALRYKRRAEIYNSLTSSKAKYFIGITSLPVLSIKPHLLFSLTFANPSEKPQALSYFIGITSLPVLSIKPYFLSNLTIANPS